MKKYLILLLILLSIRIESQTIIPENNLGENTISLEWESPSFSLAGGVSSVNNIIDNYLVLKDDKYFSKHRLPLFGFSDVSGYYYFHPSWRTVRA